MSAAFDLQEIGVKGIALCASMPHKIYEELSHSLDIPLLHIADAIGASLVNDGLDTAGIIGTRFTMSLEFIKGKLLQGFNVKTIVPIVDDQDVIQRLIYDELSVGVFEDSTEKYFLKVIDSLMADGAKAVILGCTEFPLLLKDSNSPIPLINSLSIHCEAIVRYIMNEEDSIATDN